MRIDFEQFNDSIALLEKSGGGAFGPWTDAFARWAKQWNLPQPLKDLFATNIPKTEVWAGAGTLFAEDQILKWNNDFQEALTALLLIIGSAANGDHITLDLTNGSVGYIAHEQKWTLNPRDFFVKVSPSLGLYLFDINNEASSLPNDYWQAKEGSQTH